MKKIKQKKVYKTAKKLIKLNEVTSTKEVKEYLWEEGYSKTVCHQSIISNLMDDLAFIGKLSYNDNGTYREYKLKSKPEIDILKDIYVNFFVTDMIMISFLVNRKTFNEDKLNQVKNNGDIYYMMDMKYMTNNKSIDFGYSGDLILVDDTNSKYISDVLGWVYGYFYKKLKNRKYNKLAFSCLQSDSEIDPELLNDLKTHLKENRKFILQQLDELQIYYNL